MAGGVRPALALEGERTPRRLQDTLPQLCSRDVRGTVESPALPRGAKAPRKLIPEFQPGFCWRLRKTGGPETGGAANSRARRLAVSTRVRGAHSVRIRDSQKSSAKVLCSGDFRASVVSLRSKDRGVDLCSPREILLHPSTPCNLNRRNRAVH